MRYHLAAPLVIALACSPALAQEAAPLGTTETPLPASVTQPQQFAETATIANIFEIKTSQLAKLDKLTGSSADAFDNTYVEEQLAAHEEAVALFKNYAATGSPGALKQFAAKTLPTLEGHLEAVQKLAAK